MATLTDTFVPPAWLDPDATIVASTARGERSISWTLPVQEGRKVLGNQAAIAWFTVNESKRYSGEVDWGYGQRRLTYDGPRVNFTAAASVRIRTDLAVAVNRYGFDRMWREHRHGGAESRAESARAQAAQARRAAAWWDQQAWLIELDAADMLVHEPIERDFNRREPQQATVSAHDPYGGGYATVIAKLTHEGEHVGWVTSEHTLIPDESIVRQPSNRGL